ncbi:MAG: ribbon-helix-helix domain-containing protein [Alphaproteobacteria bacterium]
MENPKYEGCDDGVAPIQSSLISRNITIFGRRTSIRLEPDMWVALNDIADRERCSVHDICALVYVRKSEATSLTAAIRVFLMLYYRAATTEQGHGNAGHGDFNEMKKRARIPAEYDSFFGRHRARRRGGKFQQVSEKVVANAS